MSIPKADIIHAYRLLHKSGLHAVQYSTPARQMLRATLNDAFRNSPSTDFVPKRIENTVVFLQNAAKARGMEHRILKNILHVRYWAKYVKKTPQQYVLNLPWGVRASSASETPLRD